MLSTAVGEDQQQTIKFHLGPGRLASWDVELLCIFRAWRARGETGRGSARVARDWFRLSPAFASHPSLCWQRGQRDAPAICSRGCHGARSGPSRRACRVATIVASTVLYSTLAARHHPARPGAAATAEWSSGTLGRPPCDAKTMQTERKKKRGKAGSQRSRASWKQAVVPRRVAEVSTSRCHRPWVLPWGCWIFRIEPPRRVGIAGRGKEETRVPKP
jgi:hypothetical protein